MAENNKALVLFDEKIRFYYTSFLSSFGCVIVCGEKKIFITDKRYVVDATKQCAPGCEVVTLSEDGLYADIKKQLEALNVKNIGFESKTLSVEQFEKLKEALPGYEFVPADDEISEAQSVKRQDEIDNIAKAQWITQKALINVVPKIKPGITEKAVAAEIVYQMMLLGAECPSFDSIVCFGANSACPHHKPSDTRLDKNDIILIDIGAKYHGYCGDMTRTFCIGKPSPEFERMHRTVKAAQQFGLERIKAGVSAGGRTFTAMLIFMLSMVLLYGASATYHSVNLSGKPLRIFRKIDHMMIFVLIAGSYTPVCLIVLGGKEGVTMLTVVWSIAIAGMLIKAFWITCPKWFSSIIYIAMGWGCVFVFRELIHTLSVPAFCWLLAGGIIYTVGGIIYALKLPIFNAKHANFGSHEIFHLFVMAGSICHFIFMYRYVA